MVRVLAMIAVAAFFVSVVAFGGAAALGGYDISKRGFMWPGSWVNWENAGADGQRLADVDWTGPQVTRDLNWTGSDEITVGVPAEVVFTQADKPSIVVTGPKGAVDKLTVDDDGEIHFLGQGNVRMGFNGVNISLKGLDGAKSLKIQIAGPNVRSFTASWGSDVTLNGVKREEFELNSRAGSRVRGTLDVNRLRAEAHAGSRIDLDGRADNVVLEVHSGGDADLARMAVKTARVEAHSGGDAVVGPTEAADLEVHSGADITLTTRPPSVNTQRHSGGDVHYRTPAAQT